MRGADTLLKKKWGAESTTENTGRKNELPKPRQQDSGRKKTVLHITLGQRPHSGAAALPPYTFGQLQHGWPLRIPPPWMQRHRTSQRWESESTREGGKPQIGQPADKKKQPQTPRECMELTLM